MVTGKTTPVEGNGKKPSHAMWLNLYNLSRQTASISIQPSSPPCWTIGHTIKNYLEAHKKLIASSLNTCQEFTIQVYSWKTQCAMPHYLKTIILFISSQFGVVPPIYQLCASTVHPVSFNCIPGVL